MRKKNIIKLRPALFWDVDPKNINLKDNASYVIERVLEMGNDKEVKWVWNFYDKRLLKRVVAKSRALRPETKNLWKLFLKQK